MDSQNKDKPATKGGEGKEPDAAGSGFNPNTKPFILGSGGLPKLGDKAALNAFMEQNRGTNTFLGQRGPGIEGKQLFGSGGMFGNLAPLGGSMIGKSNIDSVQDSKSSTQEVQNNGKVQGSIFSSGLTNTMYDQNEEQKANDEQPQSKQKELKPDFPPPINSVFSFDLPALAQQSIANKKALEERAESGNIQPQGSVKKSYNLSSIESNAKNYLNSIQDQDDSVGQNQTQSTILGNDNTKHDVSEDSLFLGQPNNNNHDESSKQGGIPAQKRGMFPSSILSSLGGINSIKQAQTDDISNEKNEQAKKKTTSQSGLPIGSSINASILGGSGNNIMGSLANRTQSGPSFSGAFNFPQQNARNSIQNSSTQGTGDMITSKYHTYNSIGTLAPLVNQDENLSITLDSNNVKIFVNPDQSCTAKNLICFIENNQTKQEAEGQGKSVEPNSNISFLVNQTDQIPNILSSYHKKGRLQGTILDFTVRQFRYLYLLYAKSIVVLDFSDLLTAVNSSACDVSIIDSIQLMPSGAQKNLHLFTCIEVANSHETSLILFNDIASRRSSLAFSKSSVAASESKTGDTETFPQVLHIDCSSSSKNGGSNQSQHIQTMLSFGEQPLIQGSAILDIEIWSSYLAILFEKNQIIVFDLSKSQKQSSQSKALSGKASAKKNQSETDLNDQDKLNFNKPIFRAKFPDATETISQIFFVADFQKVLSDDSSNEIDSDGREDDDSEDSGKESSGVSKKLNGHFLLVETKGLGSSKLSEANLKDLRKKAFRKLHIVEIQDPLGPLYLQDANQKQSSRAPTQSLKQIDQLTITELTSKFLSYDYEKGIVFMLNQDKQDRLIKFFTVKLKRDALAEDSDSDEAAAAKSKSDPHASKANCLQRLRFEYITEVRLQISNESFSAIQKATQAKPSASSVPQQPLPAYLKVLNTSAEKERSGLGSDSENYYIYSNILDQVLVFERPITEMRPTSTDMIKTLSTSSQGLKSPAIVASKEHFPSVLGAGGQADQSTTKGGIIDMSKLGFMPGSYKKKILKQSRDMMDTNSQKDKPQAEDSDALDEDDLGLIEDPLADKNQLDHDIQENEEDFGAAENIVCDILGDESDSPKNQDVVRSAQVMMQQIDRECREEEEQDAKLLLKKIREETQDILSNDEEDEASKTSGQLARDKQKNTGGKRDNFVYVKKEKEAEDPQQNQNLTKKERKALKKQENKKTTNNTATVEKTSTSKDQSQSLSSIPAAVTRIKQSSEPEKKKQTVQSAKIQDQIVENFQELTRKYQDLAQKMNQLQQQVNRQQQQKIEVDTVIRKAVKDGVSSLMMQQMKEIIVPVMTKKMKSLDDQVSEVILPKVEEQIGRLFQEIIEKGELISANGRGGGENQVTPQAIQQLVQKEFRESMSSQIVPSIELVFKKLLQQLEKKLEQVDLALCEKLAEDEDKHENMVQYYQNSLVWLKTFHNKVGGLAKDQLKNQMQQQIEFQKEMSREYQNELQSRVQETIQSQIQAQVQQQVQQQVQIQLQQQIQLQVQQQVQIQIQHQVQQQLQAHGIGQGQQQFFQQQQNTAIPPLLSTPTHSQQSFGAAAQQPVMQQNFMQPQGRPSSFNSFQSHPPSQSQVVVSQPLEVGEDAQQDDETQMLIAQLAEIQSKLKQKQSGVKLRRQQSSQNKKDKSDYNFAEQNIDHKFGNDKNVINFKVGQNKRSVLMYENSEEDDFLEKEARLKTTLKQESRANKKVQKMLPNDFWDLDQAQRGDLDSDPEDVDDGEKYFEREQQRNEEYYNEGNRYAQEPRVKAEKYEDDEEDKNRSYKEPPSMRPYDDGQAFKNEKPVGSSIGASANMGAMRLLMNQNHKVEEKQPESAINDRIDNLIYQGYTEQHKQRLFGDKDGFVSSDAFDGKSEGGPKKHRQLERMQFGVPTIASKHTVNQNASDFLNSSLEDRGEGNSKSSKSKNVVRELTSWKDSQKDPMDGFSGYGIQRHPQPLSSQQKKAQRDINRNRGNQKADEDMPSWY